jgi:anhydro-N-acetylmuramic acid kinase
MMRELYIGVMSGTSLDGVDVVLCEIDALTCKVLAFLEYPFDPVLKAEILELIATPNTLEKMGEVDYKLGHLFADAIKSLLEEDNLNSGDIHAVGLHGQTLWHKPDGAFPFTLQWGDPNIVSVETDIRVVADFRRRDIALGGQGAPFAPAFHQFLFAKSHQKCALLNIGGMANITILGDELIGYDTGPGNVLMDYWIDKELQQSYDASGSWARSGMIHSELLVTMLEDEYFAKPYPKSTGRERFNGSWLEQQLERLNMKSEDVQATLLALSVHSIANELKKFDIEELIVCGGGAKNSALMEDLAVALPDISIKTIDYGDALEAMAFAWLAYKRIHREKVALSSVTGARENTILGGIYG